MISVIRILPEIFNTSPFVSFNSDLNERRAIPQVAYAMALDTIIVNDSGIQIAYTDSGVPSQSPYITVVAIHGMLFSARSFPSPIILEHALTDTLLHSCFQKGSGRLR